MQYEFLQMQRASALKHSNNNSSAKVGFNLSFQVKRQKANPSPKKEAASNYFQLDPKKVFGTLTKPKQPTQ
jgi:hypothetical protein